MAQSSEGIGHDDLEIDQRRFDLYSQTIDSVFDKERIKRRTNQRRINDELASLCMRYYSENFQHFGKESIEDSVITPFVRLYDQVSRKRRRTFVEDGIIETYDTSTPDLFELLEKIAAIPAEISCIEESERGVSSQKRFANVLKLFEHIYKTYADGLRDFLGGKEQGQLLLPPIKCVDYKLNDSRTVKTNVSLSFNTDPLENILHTVDTCRFNLRNATLGSLLDTADPHIQYLVLKSSHKETPETLGITIIHDSEGKDSGNAGKKYLMVEGFFGIDALRLGLKSGEGVGNVHTPIFEYILDSLVKLAHEKGRELVFNISFNTSHPSQGNIEWANFLVRRFSGLNEDIYIFDKEDKKGNRFYKPNKRHDDLDNKWPTIKLQKERSSIDDIVDVGRFRYCNSYFRDIRKRLLAKQGAEKDHEFQWNKAEGRVRYVGMNKAAIDERVNESSFADMRRYNSGKKRKRRILPYIAAGFLSAGIAGIATYSGVSERDIVVIEAYGTNGKATPSDNKFGVVERRLPETEDKPAQRYDGEESKKEETKQSVGRMILETLESLQNGMITLSEYERRRNIVIPKEEFKYLFSLIDFCRLFYYHWESNIEGPYYSGCDTESSRHNLPRCWSNPDRDREWVLDQRRLFYDNFSSFLEILNKVNDEEFLHGLREYLEIYIPPTQLSYDFLDEYHKLRVSKTCEHSFFEELNWKLNNVDITNLYEYWYLLMAYNPLYHQTTIIKLDKLIHMVLSVDTFAKLSPNQQLKLIIEALRYDQTDASGSSYEEDNFYSTFGKHPPQFKKIFFHSLYHILELSGVIEGYSLRQPKQHDYRQAVVFADVMTMDCVRYRLDEDCGYRKSYSKKTITCVNDSIDSLVSKIKGMQPQDLEQFQEKDFPTRFHLCEFN